MASGPAMTASATRLVRSPAWVTWAPPTACRTCACTARPRPRPRPRSSRPANLIKATDASLARYKNVQAAFAAGYTYVLKHQRRGAPALQRAQPRLRGPPPEGPVLPGLRDQRAAPCADPARRDVHRERPDERAADRRRADPLALAPDRVRERQADHRRRSASSCAAPATPRPGTTSTPRRCCTCGWCPTSAARSPTTSAGAPRTRRSAQCSTTSRPAAGQHAHPSLGCACGIPGDGWVCPGAWWRPMAANGLPVQGAAPCEPRWPAVWCPVASWGRGPGTACRWRRGPPAHRRSEEQTHAQRTTEANPSGDGCRADGGARACHRRRRARPVPPATAVGSHCGPVSPAAPSPARAPRPLAATAATRRAAVEEGPDQGARRRSWRR